MQNYDSKLKIIITIFIFFGVLFLARDSFAATRLLYENFDDQIVDSPLVTREYGLWNIAPPRFSWGTGRGGSGYSYGSGTTLPVFVSWERGSGGELWYTNELYVSFWMRYPTWITDGDSYWNLKFFYIQEKGSGGGMEFDASGNGSDGFFYQIRGDGGSVAQSGWDSTPNAWDGNWHHYEWFVHRTQGIYRFWYDGTLVIDQTFGQIWGDSRYDISFMSIDGQTDNVFTRFIDDIEVWDGMPAASSDTTPPAAPSAVVVN
jgi:hypothetical protein